MTGSKRPLALVVEDDRDQRELLGALFEESDMKVIACESAEAALLLLDRYGPDMSLLFTDVRLAGVMDGAELAHLAHERFPGMTVIVTSGLPCPYPLPTDTKFMQKPWLALDVLRAAEKSLH